MKQRRSYFYLIAALLVIICGGYLIYRVALPHEATTATTTKDNSVLVTATKQKSQPSTLHTPIDWQKSSETKPYPDLSQVKDFWIKVELKKNRTYLMSGDKVIYTMYSSGGAYHRDKETGKTISYTPTGTFYIEPERGASFFNNSLNEGANNWISWKDHGIYLFHSVPTDANGNYNVTEAKKLGKTPASHGCIRLSVPDSKWMSENLPTGTKVVVKD